MKSTTFENFLNAEKIVQLGHWEWDLTRNETIYSQEVIKIFGDIPEEFGNRTKNPSYPYFHPDDKILRHRAIEKGKIDGKYETIYRIYPNGNEEKYIHERGEVIFDKEKNPKKIFGTVLDITERIKIENSLREALHELKNLKEKIEAENHYLKEEVKYDHNFEEIITVSENYKRVLNKVQQVAVTNATVLILGETGTGKELIARAIHAKSSRKNKALVKINCAALQANLIESELFGHIKGAFTNAISDKKGKFHIADGGTIFLDEVGELPLDLQSKLLRVLQEGEFEPLGSNKILYADVRIIAATNRNLEEEVKKGHFREDLYFRLNVFPIFNLPLRERKDDIIELANFFIKKFHRYYGKNINSISKRMKIQLERYSWPGNIRELENIIERAVILCNGKKLDYLDWLPKNEENQSIKSKNSLIDVEKTHILQILYKTGWRIRGNNGAAEILGIKPTSLESKMKKLKINRPS